MPLILRIAIVLVAALELYWFWDGSPLALETLMPPVEARGVNLLFAILVGIVAPLCALAAAGLAIAGKRLRLAGILLCVAPVAYMVPSLAFAVAVMMYGF